MSETRRSLSQILNLAHAVEHEDWVHDADVRADLIRFAEAAGDAPHAIVLDHLAAWDAGEGGAAEALRAALVQLLIPEHDEVVPFLLAMLLRQEQTGSDSVWAELAIWGALAATEITPDDYHATRDALDIRGPHDLVPSRAVRRHLADQVAAYVARAA